MSEDDAPATTGEIWLAKGLKHDSYIFSWPITEAGFTGNDFTLTLRCRDDGEFFLQITKDWDGADDG